MKYSSAIKVTNSSNHTKIFCLEPWAEEFEMLPEMTFEIVIESDNDGEFEIDFGESRITCYAWWSSVAQVLLEGENICKSGQVLVPGPIGKMSLADSIKWLFGKD